MIRYTNGQLIITVSFRGILPVINLIRVWLLDFHIARCDHRAPFLAEMVVKRNELNAALRK